MMGKIRRTEINIETHEVKIIKFRGTRFSVYCERCRTTVKALSIEQTAGFFNLSLTDVCRLIGTDRFHLVETTRGLPQVCGKSLGSETKALRLKASSGQL